MTTTRQDALPELPRPKVTYADHSYPAYSAKQMTEYALSAIAALSAPMDAPAQTAQAPAQQDIAAFEVLAKYQGLQDFTKAANKAKDGEIPSTHGRKFCPATYYNFITELAYRVWANKDAAPIQPAVQDAAQYTCELHKDEVKKGGKCVWCQLDDARTSAAQIRNDTLEEAAKACEARVGNNDPGIEAPELDQEAMDCATAVRSLKSSEVPMSQAQKGGE